MVRAAWVLALLAVPDETPPLSTEQLREAESLVQRLGEDDFDVRDRASAGLAALGRGVVPFLKERIKEEKDLETRGRIADVIARFPSIEVVLTAVREKGKVGQPLPLELRLKNAGEGPVLVLPPLDASEFGLRFPRYEIEIRDAEGRLQGLSRGRT